MIGERIKRIREIKGVKQATVAKALGISQQLYSQLEAGQIKLNGERLEKIAEALELTIEHIMEFDEDNIFQNSNVTYDNHGTNNNYTNYGNLELELKKAYETHIADLKQQLDEKQRIIDKLLAK